MKQSKFLEISDKIFSVVSWIMGIVFILNLIVTFLSYNGVQPDIIIWSCRIFWSTHLTVILAVIAAAAQILFVISHLKNYKGERSDEFLIALLILTLLPEFLVVWLLCVFDLHLVFYLWIPTVMILVETTRKNFRKGTNKIFNAVTWIMTIGFVMSVIAAIVSLLKNKSSFPDWYNFVFSVIPYVQVLIGVIIFAQISFLMAYSKELKEKGCVKFKLALMLNTVLVVILTVCLNAFAVDECYMLYLCAAPFLIYVKLAGKKFFKTTA